MGCWGMGMTQSDEFCEVYDHFMEFYDEGECVQEITKRILEEYHEEFADSDGVLHDVYFALAKAQWMCCEQSPDILRSVKAIMDSGANLDFYRELGAHESDLKIRRNNLDKFWNMLQTPRAAPRKRKKKAKDTDAEKGMVFWYRSNGVIYGAVVLEILPGSNLLVGLSDGLTAQPKTVDEVLAAQVYTAAWFFRLLPANRVHILGTAAVSGCYNGRAGMYDMPTLHYCDNIGTPAHWTHEKDRVLTFGSMKMQDLLKSENVPAEFKYKERLPALLRQNGPVL